LNCLNYLLNGYALFGFQIQPEFGSSDYLPLVKKANVRLEITLNKALTETVSVILYAEFPFAFEIDGARNVTISDSVIS